MDDVFRALADPSRRALLDALNARDGQTLRELCGGLDMARQSVSKHLAVLEAANLVTTAWRGREKLHHLNPEPIGAVADRWIRRYDRARVQALADLKTALEDPVTGDFVYTTYIRSTPEQVWRALTEPEFTTRYWGVTLHSDWTAGAPIVWEQADGTLVEHPEQVVLEADPPARLSYTWHTFTPGWAAAVGIEEDLRATLAAEPRTRATFEIEPARDGVVRLTVVHGGLTEDGAMRGMISEGWPEVLSSVKSLLETGDVLAAP